MHPRLAELTEYLDEQRAVLTVAVDEVPSALHTTKPPSGGWSVAEILEHLVLVERRITRSFGTWVKEARAGGIAREQDDRPIFSSIDTAAILNRSRRATAPPAGVPTGTMSADEANLELQAIRAEMKAVIASADGLALTEIVKPHPVLGQANMYKWIAFTAAHMGRHAAQIRTVGVELQAVQGA